MSYPGRGLLSPHLKACRIDEPPAQLTSSWQTRGRKYGVRKYEVKDGSLIARGPGGRVGRMVLSERDRTVLDVERSWWLDGRSKTDVVRARLGVSLSRYNQLLTDIVSRPEALEFDALVVLRARRARERRRWVAMGGAPAGRGRQR